jgi:hypothetical protein
LIIKKPDNQHSKKAYKLKHYINILSYATLAIVIIMIIIAIPLVQKNWNYLKPKFDFFNARFGISNILHMPEIIGYKVRSTLETSEKININIKHVDLQKIEYMRQNAQKGNKNFTYVPAKINYETEEYKVKIRLKGDRKIHYEDLDNSSFRIKIKGNNTLFGMKVFSIHKPRARNYIEEWIYLKMMEDEGLIAPRYKFIQVSVNGKNNGLYVAEEHYTKYLIENRKHKDGPIIRFNEHTTLNYKLATIEPYESKKWTHNDNIHLTNKAIYLLDGFRKEKLRIDEVFDVKKLATFFAIADLNLARHGVVAKSLRFYYNPITSKLEPIPFDGHRGTSLSYQNISAELGITKDKNWTYKSAGNWFRHFFNRESTYNKEFYSEYIRALYRISKKSYLDDFFTIHKDEIDTNLLLIYGDNSLHDNIFSFGPFPYYFDKSSYYKTQQSIKSLLNKHNIEAYLEKVDGKSVIIDIINKHRTLPCEIVSLTYKNITSNYNEKNNTILVKETPKAPRSSTRFKFDVTPFLTENKLIEKNNLSINYKFPGLDKVYSTAVYPWKKSGLIDIKDDLLRLKSNIEKFPFIKVNKKDKIILIEKGTHTLTKSLIVPPGYIFKIEPGVILNLLENTLILSHSPLEWLGDKKNPIIINSVDKTKKGQGVFVLKADRMSNISFVHFKNLSHPNANNWNVSGSVSFYESDVTANKIRLEDNDAEDGLNIIRSKFTINESLFINMKSDALDVDFGEGEINRSSFTRLGNDAIDVSGTDLKLSKINIVDVGDKAISAGEKSNIEGDEIVVDQAEICVTSKDNSNVTLSNVILKNSKLGLTAFQKKSEYGPGRIEIENYNFINLGLDHAIEVKSSLKLNDQSLRGTVTDVKALLYGNKFGKKSK